MRPTLALLAMAALFAALGFAQGANETFYFTQPTSPADIDNMATMIRTVVDLQDISIDREHHALVARATTDKLVATEWLFHQLDRPGGTSAPAATAQYKMSGGSGDVVSVFRVAPAASVADITALTTAIRTVADLQRVFPYEGQKAIVARGTPEKIAAADWMVRQLLPADGETPTTDSPAYPMEAAKPEGPGEAIRVFRMDPKATNADLTAMVTAIRTVADLQRVFPFESGKAVILRGPSDPVAVAEWLVHEVGKPADPKATHETSLPGVTDGVVRLFFAAGRPARRTWRRSPLRSAPRLPSCGYSLSANRRQCYCVAVPTR